MTARMFADQLLLGERGLAHAEVDVAHLVGAVLDPAALELGDRLADVRGHGARSSGWASGHGDRGRGRARRPGPSGPGVAMATSKSRKPPLILATRSSAPTTSAPASRASVAASPAANTATRLVRPVPSGSESVPRTIWSALRGSTPSRTASSTVSSNLALGERLHELDRLADAVELLAVDLAEALLVLLPVLGHACSPIRPVLARPVSRRP